MRQHLRLAVIVAIAAAGAWVFVRALQSSVVDFARVTNESMLPHLKPGQVIVINKLAPCLKLPFTSIRFLCSPCETGSAYLFPNPTRSGQKLVKFAVKPAVSSPLRRDIIWFTQGAATEAQSTSAVPSCHFEGSNRESSIDSRHFGPVPLGHIDGKVVYPPLKWNAES